MNQQGDQQRTLQQESKESRGAVASCKEDNIVRQHQKFYQDHECAICLDILSKPYIIPACCHRFCCDCIHKWIEDGNKECPTCRVHIVSKHNLRRDELFGKLLTRLLKVRSKVKMMKLKQKKSTSLPLEKDKTDGPCDEEKKSAKSKKRKGKRDETHGQDVKRAKSKKYFEHRLIDLRKFKKKHGHCNVPDRYEDDLSLGKWVSSIRYSYKQIQLGKKPRQNLTQAKIRELEDIGFQWTCSKNLSFDLRITKLQQFKEKHGHCNVPQKYDDDPSLGEWVGHIRRAYKQIQLGKKPRQGLTKTNIKKLEKMGFQWQLRKILSFDLQITKLQQFKEKHGHCNVPTKYEDDSSLGVWVSSMRHSYKQIQLGKKPRYCLTQANIEQLEKMGFQWQLRKSRSKP